MDLKKRTFSTYEPWNAETRRIKNIAGLYVKEYADKKESIAFIGQAGAGKTHLGIAIMQNFLEMGIQVIYMAYREEITKLKQNVMNDLEYQKMMKRFKSCEVLFIDDLFKGTVTDSDKKIIFEIVNSRYINGRPLIISSELTIEKLLDVDEATGSRIYEMTKNYLVEIRGRENNYRLKRG